MTVLCGPSGSRMQAGFAPFVYIGPAALGALMTEIPIPWAVPLAAALGALTYDLSTFCVTDPPDDPGLDAADIIGFLSVGNPALHHAAALRVQQLFDRYMWYRLCECVDYGPVTPPADPGEPTDMPQINPPFVGYPQLIPPCLSQGLVNVPTDSTHSLVSANLLMGGLNVTAIRAVVVRTILAGAGDTARIDVTQSSSVGTYVALRTDSQTIGPTGTADITVPPYPGADHVIVTCNHVSGSGTSNNASNLYFFCNGELPNTPVQPCCPPDPEVAQGIARILETVLLIQRQAVPFGYVYGANHADLTGHGSISVADLIGVSVDVTTLPNSIGAADGTPVELFDVGFVTLGTSDGYEHSRRIDHDGTLFLPYAAGAFTLVGYTLAPGVTVAIRELVRES